MECPDTEFGLQKAREYPTEMSHSQSEKVKYLGLMLHFQSKYSAGWMTSILEVLNFPVAGLHNYS